MPAAGNSTASSNGAAPPPAAATAGVEPEHLALCMLASALVAAPPPSEGWGYGFDGPTAQRQLALLLLQELQDTSSPTLSALPTLMASLQQQLGDAGTVLARAVLARLQALQSPDDLVELSSSLGGFLAAPGTVPEEATDAASIPFIATTSPLGLFLRRVRLGLGTLGMQGLSALADTVQRCVRDTLAHLSQQQQAAAAAAPGAGAATQHASPGSTPSKALKDPAVLDAYVNTLLAAVDSLGACLPAAAVEAAAAPLACLHGCPPKLDFLQLATSLAHRDLAASLAALHRYFDSSSGSGGEGSIGMAGDGRGGSAWPTPGVNSSVASFCGLLQGSGSSGAGGSEAAGARGKAQHQAALHSLAALQISMGHPQEALVALQELLRLGQQQGDEWGLLHGLASLCRVMAASEGLQATSSSSSSGAGSSSGNSNGGPGWGLLDLRRTEQQLQLQSLLQRCLDVARDMRAPHIAAHAAVALCRFRLQHASAGSSDACHAAPAAAVPGCGGSGSWDAAAGGGSDASAAATSLSVQRMLLDVATLEHQAAIAAAAPGTTAVAAAAAAAAAGAGAAAGQAPAAAALAARSSDLYAPTEAFGTGTSSAAPGSVSASAPGAAAAAAAAHPPGAGWRASAAAVSAALATAHVLAAAALQLQGASTLAGVRCLMLLTGPGGAGVDGLLGNRAVAAALAAAAAVGDDSHGGPPAAAAAAAAAGGGSGALTGCSISCDDVAAGWLQLVGLVQELQGPRAAQHVLRAALRHFPHQPPQQLVLAQQRLAVQRAVQAGRMRDAWAAAEQLQCLAPLAPNLGLELQLVAAEAHARVLLAAGCCGEAHDAAASLFAAAAGSGMQPAAVGALLLLSRACLGAGDAAGALLPALSALLHCQRLSLDGLLPEALLLVAAAWQALAPGADGGEAHEGFGVGSAGGDGALGDSQGLVGALLQQVLPLAHATGKLRVWGDVEATLAKLQLAAAPATQQQQQQQHRSQSQDSLQPVLAAVQQRLGPVAAAYEAAGDAPAARNAWLLLAHVCNAAGREDARDEAAARWQQWTQRLPAC